MATREQLGLQVGDVAIWGYAKKTSIHADGSRGEVSGIPLDTLGADLTVSLGRVEQIRPNGTSFRCITTYTEETFEPDETGEVRFFHDRYPKLLNVDGSGDPQLARELHRAGIEITREPDPIDPSFTYYYVSKNTEPEHSEKDLVTTLPDQSLALPAEELKKTGVTLFQSVRNLPVESKLHAASGTIFLGVSLLWFIADKPLMGVVQAIPSAFFYAASISYARHGNSGQDAEKQTESSIQS